MIPRKAAYLAALAKTEGREFDFKGGMVLSEVEEEALREADLRDFGDEFRRFVETEIRLRRLAMLDAQVK